MLNIATSSAVFLTLSFAFIAEAADCPLVDIAGVYTVSLRTEKASSWYGVGGNNFGCRKTAEINWSGSPITINPDGTMVGAAVVWEGGKDSGNFGGRVKLNSQPIKWVAAAGDVEMKGTWQGGELSGEFVQRFIEGKKEVECSGKVSGFKAGK
jgi:hypothetical protein